MYPNRKTNQLILTDLIIYLILRKLYVSLIAKLSKFFQHK